MRTHKPSQTHREETIQHELLWCNYFSCDVKNYSKSMRWKVFCSLSQELALFTSLQHIICSISQSQLFSLSYCHTHSTTVYHTPHLTRRWCAHACVCSPSCVCCCIVGFFVLVLPVGFRMHLLKEYNISPSQPQHTHTRTHTHTHFLYWLGTVTGT